MNGKIMRSTGTWYEVLGDDGEIYTCRIRGKMRLEGYKESNPVAVGDRVELDVASNEANIKTVLPRTNHILRQSVKKTGHAHVLAANVDQVMLIATLSFPRTSLGFIDRFLVSAESFRIPQILVFNKEDLLSEKDRETMENHCALYASIGVLTFHLSGLNDDLGPIRKALDQKTTLIAGPSGVGKSTLLNRLAPHINQKTAGLSQYHEKGTHTTTFAEMFPLAPGTFVIDTPGIKEWGLMDMEPEEISDYFPEMRDRRLGCKFGAHCLHLSEPHCAIRKALADGAIAESRYKSYVSMALGEDTRK